MAIPRLVTRYYKRRMPWVFLITFGGMTLAAGPWVWTERIRSMTCGLGVAWSTAVSLAATMLPLAIWFAIVVTWERRLMRRLARAEDQRDRARSSVIAQTAPAVNSPRAAQRTR